jgi:hypothetical protein
MCPFCQLIVKTASIKGYLAYPNRIIYLQPINLEIKKMKLIKFLLPVAILAIALTACKSKTSNYSHVPKNSIYIAGINPMQIESKVFSDSLTQASAVASLKDPNAQTDLKKALEKWNSFKNSGIDLTKKIIFFAYLNSGNAKNAVGAISAFVLDAKKFEAYVKNERGSATVSNKSGITIMRDETNEWILGISDGKVIGLGKADNIVMPMDVDMPRNRTRGTTTNLEETLIKLFKQPNSESMADNKRFNEALESKDDVFLFMPKGASVAMLNNGAAGLGKLPELLKDNEGLTYINFEKGKIIANSTAWFGTELSKILAANAGKTINPSNLEKLPYNNLVAAVGANFKTQLVYDIIKAADLEELWAVTKQKSKDIDLDNLIKAIDGDLNIIIADLNPQMISIFNPITFVLGTNTAVEIKIGDKQAFANIMDKMVAEGDMVKTADGYAPNSKDGSSLPVGLSITMDRIVITSKKENLAKFMAGGQGKQLPADVKQKLNGQSTAMYIDIVGLVQSVSNVPEIKANKAIGIFENALFTMGNFSNNELKGVIEVNLNNKNENALAAFLKAGIQEKNN